MIEKNMDEFEFDGPISYVLQANELTNELLKQTLARRRYKHFKDERFNPSEKVNVKSYFNSRTFTTTTNNIAKHEKDKQPGTFFDKIRTELLASTTKKHILPDFLPAKISDKTNGYITAYAANTNTGTCRTYNEDRVAIIQTIS